MPKAKSLFGLWSQMKVSDINRLLREHNVRLVMKRSREWGEQVTITAHPIDEPALTTLPAGGRVAFTTLPAGGPEPGAS